MRIVSAQIENYKSFLDSGDIQFSPGFNVIVGQNNAGKTALVEALSLDFDNKHHRSSITVPTPLIVHMEFQAFICLLWSLGKNSLNLLSARFLSSIYQRCHLKLLKVRLADFSDPLGRTSSSISVSTVVG